MRPLAPALASLVLLAPHLAAQEARTAADVTEAWRGMARVFDRALPFEDATSSEARTLLLLVDATPALAASGFANELARALERHAESLGQLKLGVSRAGVEKPLLAPSDDPRAIVEAVRGALAAPSDRILNVYADLRALCAQLAPRGGEHAILLATLDNGDAEDDLEATAARLAGTKARLFVLASEAYVADCYWGERTYQDHPRETQLTGGDSAVIDMPWGWLFQLSSSNELTPSGFACYGLNRLAAASGGRVFVHSPPNAGAHTCAIWGTCLFCSGDHVAEDEVYGRALLAPLSPSVAPRGEVLEELGSDPCFRAVSNAWRAALQAGLLRGTPPRAGHWTGIDNNASGKAALLLGNALDRNAERAEAATKDCERILAALDAELGRADPAKGSARSRAMAEYARVMLQLTKLNLVGYAGWCREIAPRWFAKDGGDIAPPELAALRGDARNVVIGYTTRSLCHGVRPFREIELPGGARFAKELAELERLFDAYEQRYAHTPFAVALHRQGIATFHQSLPGTYVEPKRPRSKSSPENGPQSGGAGRPARTGGGSSGGTGPATGGGG